MSAAGKPADLGRKSDRDAARQPQQDQREQRLPWIGSRPVQFGIAVSRKPVITAGRKP